MSAHIGARHPAQWISITGVVALAAEVRLTRGTEPHVLLLLEVSTGSGLPVWVQHDMGSGTAAQAAAVRKAELLRRGDRVTVVCAGLRVRSAPDYAGLVGMHVSAVLPARTTVSPTTTVRSACSAAAAA